MKLPSASKLIPASLVLIVGGLAAVDLYGCSASPDEDAELIGSVAQSITNCSTSLSLAAGWAPFQCSMNGPNAACTNRFVPGRDVTGTLTIPSEDWYRCNWTGSTCDNPLNALGCTPECPGSGTTTDCTSQTSAGTCNFYEQTGSPPHFCGWFDPDGAGSLTARCYQLGECY